MPLTKSEVMYFGIGLAIGSAAGANWPKIKKVLEPMLDAAGGGFGEAYADVAEKIANMVETAQDSAAERRNGSKKKSKKKRKREKKRTDWESRVPAPAEP